MVTLETRAPKRSPKQPRKRHKAGRRHPVAAYLLLSPALVLYLTFIAVPLVALIVVSFLQWDLISPAHLAGLNNYRQVAHDPDLGQTLSNTFLLDIMTTALHLVLGMGLALGVTSVRARAVRYWARTAIVTPFLMSAGVVALMWSYILAGETGPFNYYLTKIGLSPPNWLGSFDLGHPRARYYRRVGHSRVYVYYILGGLAKYSNRPVRGGCHRWSGRFCEVS